MNYLNFGLITYHNNRLKIYFTMKDRFCSVQDSCIPVGIVDNY